MQQRHMAGYTIHNTEITRFYTIWNRVTRYATKTHGRVHDSQHGNNTVLHDLEPWYTICSCCQLIGPNNTILHVQHMVYFRVPCKIANFVHVNGLHPKAPGFVHEKSCSTNDNNAEYPMGSTPKHPLFYTKNRVMHSTSTLSTQWVAPQNTQFFTRKIV